MVGSGIMDGLAEMQTVDGRSGRAGAYNRPAPQGGGVELNRGRWAVAQRNVDKVCVAGKRRRQCAIRYDSGEEDGITNGRTIVNARFRDPNAGGKCGQEAQYRRRSRS